MQNRQPRSFPSPLQVAAFASLLLLCSAVVGQEPEIIELSQIGASELLWKSPDGLVPLPMGGLEIELTVTGVMVHGRISQWFHNPADEVIEALYVFPMPERAAVHHMELVVGERRIVSRETTGSGSSPRRIEPCCRASGSPSWFRFARASSYSASSVSAPSAPATSTPRPNSRR